jgi:hypothetical protein
MEKVVEKDGREMYGEGERDEWKEIKIKTWSDKQS